MPKIALIQNGTEITRQLAGVVETFEACCHELSDGRFTEFSSKLFLDEEVGFLLDGIDSEEWACLVFASNALIPGEVEDALELRREHMRNYVSSGGGVIVLHQWRDTLAPVLPSGVLPTLVSRTSKRGTASARALDPGDVLLNYPATVSWPVLRDLKDDELRTEQGPASELESLFFKALDPDTLPASLKPVLASPRGELVLVRTQDHVRERVVIATMPLDWQGARPGQADATTSLLANSISFASRGNPRRLVWYRGESTANEPALRWLGLDGAAALRPAGSGKQAFDEVDAWLLGAVDTFVVPSDRLERVEKRPEVRAFLAHGGALLTSGTDPLLEASRMTALLGRHEERRLASRLYAELHAVDGWRSVDYAFELRNIVSALAFLWEDEVDRSLAASVDPRTFDDVKGEIQKRLLDESHREDIASSVALAETLAYLEAPNRIDSVYIDWMAERAPHRGFDIGLLIRAVVALGRMERAEGFLHEAALALESRAKEMGSLVPVVRILDAIAILNQGELLEEDAESAIRIAVVACTLLDDPRFRAQPDRGWVSVEATASVTRGLIALYPFVAAERPLAAQLVGHVATGATALRQSERRYNRSPKGVAWLARLLHAVILADRSFPIGLQRLASLDWPDQESAGGTGGRAERSLLQELAHENQRLRGENVKLEEQSMAAALGRGVATLLPVCGLGAVAWIVIAAIGWDSLGGLLANIGVLLATILGFLTAIFAGLARWHLLAAPAERVRVLLEQFGLPAIISVGKLRRG
jgi:hypothetical protein